MSNYRDMIVDLTQRCRDLVDGPEWTRAYFREREVTQLLAATALGLNTPLDRLNRPEDRGTSQEAKDAWGSLETVRIVDFWGSPSSGTRRWGLLEEGAGFVREQVDSWVGRDLESDRDLSASTILVHVRHAIAHGNVLTRGINNKINEVLLANWKKASREGRNKVKDGRWWVLSCAPCDLHGLLLAWFDWIEANKTILAPDFWRGAA